MAVVSYSAAIVDRNRSETEELPNDELGSRGLISIENCVASERRTLDWYLASSNETLP